MEKSKIHINLLINLIENSFKQLRTEERKV